jgi:hypothetical protein
MLIYTMVKKSSIFVIVLVCFIQIPEKFLLTCTTPRCATAVSPRLQSH